LNRFGHERIFAGARVKVNPVRASTIAALALGWQSKGLAWTGSGGGPYERRVGQERPVDPVAYLCSFFRSLISANTSSACPSGFTLGKMWISVRSGPIRKVVRSMPHTFFPYMFFSFNTPN
jgi:hypothetical protein